MQPSSAYESQAATGAHRRKSLPGCLLSGNPLATADVQQQSPQLNHCQKITNGFQDAMRQA